MLSDMREQVQSLLNECQCLLNELRSLVPKSQFSQKRFLTVKHSAEYSDLSEESLRRLLAAKKLTALRPVRGRVLIDREELDAYIRSCKGTPRKGRGR